MNITLTKTKTSRVNSCYLGFAANSHIYDLDRLLDDLLAKLPPHHSARIKLSQISSANSVCLPISLGDNQQHQKSQIIAFCKTFGDDFSLSAEYTDFDGNVWSCR